eukprot:UN08459
MANISYEIQPPNIILDLSSNNAEDNTITEDFQ